MEYSESGPSQPPAENPKPVYQVNLRPPVFSYFAEKLGEVYRSELGEIQRDGSYQKLTDFHNSEFGKLMGRMLDRFEEPDKLPAKVSMDLSDADVKIIKNKVSPPSDAGGMRLHSEMVRELGDNFASAKMGVRAKNLLSRVRSLIKR